MLAVQCRWKSCECAEQYVEALDPSAGDSADNEVVFSKAPVSTCVAKPMAVAMASGGRKLGMISSLLSGYARFQEVIGNPLGTCDPCVGMVKIFRFVISAKPSDMHGAFADRDVSESCCSTHVCLDDIRLQLPN